MTALSDLKAAREAIRYARAHPGEGHLHAAIDRYNALLTDDTIASLIAVAEAAQRQVDYCGLDPETCMCDPEDCATCPTTMFAAALAPLVKEDTDDRA